MRAGDKRGGRAIDMGESGSADLERDATMAEGMEVEVDVDGRHASKVARGKDNVVRMRPVQFLFDGLRRSPSSLTGTRPMAAHRKVS